MSVEGVGVFSMFSAAIQTNNYRETQPSESQQLTNPFIKSE